MALSILLVTGAGLMIKSFWKMVHVDPGFDASGVLVAPLSLPRGEYDPEQASLFYERLIGEIEAMPGVISVSRISNLPLLHGRSMNDFEIFGQGAPGDGEAAWNAERVVVGRGYFETMGVPVRRGRSFVASDRPGAPLVALINEAMAGKFFGREDPVGRQIRVSGDGEPWLTIAGVVGSEKTVSLDADVRPAYYSPAEQATEHYPGWTLAGIGVAVGLGGALLATRVMETLWFDVSSTDPATFGAVAATLTGVVFLASLIPAWRASKVDPVAALRGD